MKKNQLGMTAFISYCQERPFDPHYGYTCAKAAIQDMNNKEVNGKLLYVQPAQNKNERDKQLRQESEKFIRNLEQTTLYVKGFTLET